MKKHKPKQTPANRNRAFVIFSVLAATIIFGAIFTKSRSNDLDAAAPSSLPNLVRAHNFTKGPAEAPVTIVKFFDPECEACRATHPTLQSLYGEFPGKIRIVYRYTPFHGNSVYASAVLEEAREHGKFEEALTLLFANQPVWGSHHQPQPELIPGYMEQLGLKRNLFDRETVISKHKEKIDIDEKDSRDLSVQLTPTFFVNGKKLNNIGYASLKAAIEESLD